jgi:glutathione S-transferase
MTTMGAQSAAGKPTLWHIPISHYNEKVRWALEHKGIDHVRRAPLPGSHIPIAIWMTRGGQITFPILRIDGRTIGDSTAIIAALESIQPEPALYPVDAEERAQAIELEDYFDEQLGPYTRFLAFHELLNEPEMLTDVAARLVPPALGRMKPLVGAYARAFTSVRWGARDDAAAVTAREKIVSALDRLESELEEGEGEYLVGDRFSVADLTAASLFYPLVAPPEGPTPPDTPRPPAFDEFRASLSDRPGFRWVEETFRKHRHR